MASVTMSIGVSIGGVGMQGSITRTEVGTLAFDTILPMAQKGTLTTRTDTDTGVITLDASAIPTVTVGDKITLTWITGGVPFSRHGMNVTVVAGSAITIDVGTGDVLPAVSTANITIAKQITIDVNLNGSLIVIFAYSAPTETFLDVQEVSGTSPASNPLTIPAREGYFWWDDGPVPNPFNNVNIGSVITANLDTTQTSQITLGILYDAA